MVEQPGTRAVHTYMTHGQGDISMRAHTHRHTLTAEHTGSQHQCPDHREFVLSWLGRQDESMREQLTGHAYSSAKEKREKRGARDSKGNELNPGAKCLAIRIALQGPLRGSQCL